MILSINKCVHFINFDMIFNYNDIKYILNTMKSLKFLILNIALPLRLSLNKVFYITNIK